jgi:hypothetical protein
MYRYGLKNQIKLRFQRSSEFVVLAKVEHNVHLSATALTTE